MPPQADLRVREGASAIVILVFLRLLTVAAPRPYGRPSAGPDGKGLPGGSGWPLQAGGSLEGRRETCASTRPGFRRYGHKSGARNGAASYGDPEAGDPIQYDELRIEHTWRSSFTTAPSCCSSPIARRAYGTTLSRQFPVSSTALHFPLHGESA